LDQRHSGPQPSQSAAPQSAGERLGNWSRGVTGKVKSLVPWGQSRQEEPQATASDQHPGAAASPRFSPGAAPSAMAQNPSAPVSQPSTANLPTPPQNDQRWYQKLWR
jgi:hypothetical protein